jgi:hypothetical protein
MIIVICILVMLDPLKETRRFPSLSSLAHGNIQVSIHELCESNILQGLPRVEMPLNIVKFTSARASNERKKHRSMRSRGQEMRNSFETSFSWRSNSLSFNLSLSELQLTVYHHLWMIFFTSKALNSQLECDQRHFDK